MLNGFGKGWVQLYRLVLRAMPAGLRRKHGRSMVELFVRELDRARSDGWIDGLIVTASAIWDVIQRAMYERVRRRQRGRWRMTGVWQDVAHASRSLLKAPLFTGVVVLTLALGIGANSAIFSVVDAVLLKALPFPNAERVVHLAWDAGTHTQPYLTPGKYGYWRENARTLDAVATWRDIRVRVGASGEVSAVTGLRVSGEFLSVLGYSTALGRTFTTQEDQPGGAKVALVSQGLWETRFGGAPDVLGRSLELDGEPYTVVGVLPEAFEFPYVDEPVAFLTPLGLSIDPTDEGENWPTIARLREGVTREEAEADAASLTASFTTAYPDLVYERDVGMTLATFTELQVGAAAKALWVLMGVVALVLVIACANAANLFLARATQRQGEIALRAALGASRARVVRFVLTEGILVAIAAGSLGLLMAKWGVGLLVALAPTELPRLDTVSVDWRVVLFTYGVALIVSVAFSAPALWPAAHARLSAVLKENARGASSRGLARQGLLVTQSAISMVLLAGAALLLVTLVGLARVDPGFEAENLVAVRFPVRPRSYASSADLWDLQQRVGEAVAGAPEIVSIAGATNLPLERGINFPMTIAGRPDDYGTVEWRAVTPGYFRTLGIPVVSGRAFQDTDSDGGPPVVIVNESFAREYFSGQSPIGKRIEIGRRRGEFLAPWLVGPGAEIVGVVGDIREASLRDAPRRTMYVPQAQAPTPISNVLGTMPVFIARVRRDVGSVRRVLDEAVQGVGGELPRPEVFSMDELISRSLARERFGAILLSVFAALALTLTAFGIYGVLAYTVRQRFREIGIRMALGAGGHDVRRMVLLQGITPVVIGLALGLGGVLVASRVVGQYLWGITPTDPATLAGVAAILLGVAVAASWIPARDAVRLDPVESLNAP